MIYVSKTDSIDLLQLSVRSENALKRGSILTVGELMDYPTDGYVKLKNMGAKSAAEVITIVESLKNGTNESFCLMDINSSMDSSNIAIPTERDIQYAKELEAAYGEDTSFWCHEIMLAKQERDSENEDDFLFWLYKSKALRNAVKAGIPANSGSVTGWH